MTGGILLAFWAFASLVGAGSGSPDFPCVDSDDVLNLTSSHSLVFVVLCRECQSSTIAVIHSILRSPSIPFCKVSVLQTPHAVDFFSARSQPALYAIRAGHLIEYTGAYETSFLSRFLSDVQSTPSILLLPSLSHTDAITPLDSSAVSIIACFPPRTLPPTASRTSFNEDTIAIHNRWVSTYHAVVAAVFALKGIPLADCEAPLSGATLNNTAAQKASSGAASSDPPFIAASDVAHVCGGWYTFAVAPTPACGEELGTRGPALVAIRRAADGQLIQAVTAEGELQGFASMWRWVMAVARLGVVEMTPSSYRAVVEGTHIVPVALPLPVPRSPQDSDPTPSSAGRVRVTPSSEGRGDDEADGGRALPPTLPLGSVAGAARLLVWLFPPLTSASSTAGGGGDEAAAMYSALTERWVTSLQEAQRVWNSLGYRRIISRARAQVRPDGRSRGAADGAGATEGTRTSSTLDGLRSVSLDDIAFEVSEDPDTAGPWAPVVFAVGDPATFGSVAADLGVCSPTPAAAAAALGAFGSRSRYEGGGGELGGGRGIFTQGRVGGGSSRVGGSGPRGGGVRGSRTGRGGDDETPQSAPTPPAVGCPPVTGALAAESLSRAGDAWVYTGGTLRDREGEPGQAGCEKSSADSASDPQDELRAFFDVAVPTGAEIVEWLQAILRQAVQPVVASTAPPVGWTAPLEAAVVWNSATSVREESGAAQLPPSLPLFLDVTTLVVDTFVTQYPAMNAVVLYHATWCGFSLAAYAALQRVADAFAATGTRSVVVLAVEASRGNGFDDRWLAQHPGAAEFGHPRELTWPLIVLQPASDPCGCSRPPRPVEVYASSQEAAADAWGGRAPRVRDAVVYGGDASPHDLAAWVSMHGVSTCCDRAAYRARPDVVGAGLQRADDRGCDCGSKCGGSDTLDSAVAAGEFRGSLLYDLATLDENDLAYDAY